MEALMIAIFSAALGYGVFAVSERERPVPDKVQPKDWTNQEHSGIMMVCRTMCDKHVLEYVPLTGECRCREK